jgi:ethylbenzene dioxygenase beta subunit
MNAPVRTTSSRAPVPPPPLTLVPRDLAYEIEQFLLREARLLDDEDIHYWMPGIQARYRRDPTPRFDPKRMAFFDDDLTSLRRRVTRALHETAWAEDPPTRTVHLVQGIEVQLSERPDEYIAYSTFICVRGRNEMEEDWLAGRRIDRIRRIADGSLRLARREIRITQTVLQSKNLNVFL